MTVAKLIRVLGKCKSPARASVTFYVGETEYDISSVGQFGIVPDVDIKLEKREYD